MKETDKHVLSSAGVDSQRGKLLIMMSLVQVQLGEPKERNPKLLPIGDGFGFLVIFEENIFSGDLS